MGREATRQQVEKGARTARIIDIYMRNKGTS
jgi:hypothetical protein